jgi:LysR family transcriptional regulator for metE and metH
MSLRLETRHLRLVATLAEEKTLTRAARRLFLSQSALSKQLLELEARLGGPLFLRAGKRLVATQAGLRLLATATPVLQELEKAEDDLKRIATGQSGRIRLATECYTAYHWLPPVLERYNKRFPHVDVEINTGATREPLAALFAGDIDLAIVSRDPEDARLTSYPIFEDELVAVVPPCHPLAEREFITAQDFANEHYIMYSMSREDSTVFQEVLDPAGVVPKRVSTMQLTEGTLALVKAGVGIAVLARWAIAPDLDCGAVRAVRVTPNGLIRKWCGVLIRQPEMPVHLSAFAKMLAVNPAREIARSAPGRRRA